MERFFVFSLFLSFFFCYLCARNRRYMLFGMKHGIYALVAFAWMWTSGVKAQVDTIHITRGLSIKADTARLHRRALLADSILSERYYTHTSTDSNYIRRPDERLTLKLRYNVSGASVRGIGKFDHRYTSHISSDLKGTLSVGATYMGLSLGFALNPGALIGRYKDYEINVTSYGNRFGFEYIYQHARNFEGWGQVDNGPHTDIPTAMISMYTTNINAYYAFGGRRFSYPAAFTQSYIQRRSAGSWMLAASFQTQNLHSHADTTDGTQQLNLKVTNFGIGGGYGHNFVTRRNWLFHVSVLPTFVVAANNRMTLEGERHTMNGNFSDVIVTGRTAVVHTWHNRFAGMSAMYTNTIIGRHDDVQVRHLKWRVRLFVGMRLFD